MRFQKLITRLKQISLQEKKQLSSYIHSPYFNVPTTSIALFDYLSGIHQSIADKYLTEMAIKNTVPVLSTAPIQNKAATGLLKAIESFYVQKEIEKDTVYTNLMRLQMLSSKRYNDDYDEKYIAVKQEILAQNGVKRYMYELHLEELNQHHLVRVGNRQEVQTIDSVIAKLDTYYAIKKLRYLCELTQRQSWVVIAAQNEVDAILKLLSPFNTKEHHYIYLWLRVFEMIKSSSIESEAYEFVKQYLLTNTAKQLSVEDNRVLDYTISVAIRNINCGAKGAMEYLLWMELKERYQLLIIANQIQPVVYQNLLVVGVYAKRPASWMNRIKKYYQYLPDKYRDSYYLFACGLCCYAEGEYLEAANYLEQAYSKNEILFNHVLKRWSFMSRYQYLENNSLLFNFLDSWRKQLPAIKLAYPNAALQIQSFISYANKLLKAGLKPQRQKLLKDLQKEPYFAGKDWIENQASK